MSKVKMCLVVVFVTLSVSSFAQKNSTLSSTLFDTVYAKPQILASYPGGEKAWKKYIKKHMKYPKKAWWDEIETEVTVKLIIEKDGTLSNAYHLTVSDYGFEQEAVRLVRQSGKWIPAKHNGKAVKSEGELTIPFRLR